MKKLFYVFCMSLVCSASHARHTEFGSDVRTEDKKIVSFVLDEKTNEPICFVDYHSSKFDSQALDLPECGPNEKVLADSVHIDGVDVAVLPMIALIGARFLVASAIGCTSGIIGGAIISQLMISGGENITGSVLTGSVTSNVLFLLDLSTKYSISAGLVATACSFYAHKVISVYETQL